MQPCGGGGGRVGNGLGRGFDESPGFVADQTVGNAVAVGIVLLDVADSAGGLREDGRHAGIAAAAGADRPVHGFADADSESEIVALRREIAGPDKGGSASVAAP